MFKRSVAASAYVLMGMSLVVGVGAGAHWAGARSTMMAPPASPVIATLDIETAWNQLKERSDLEASLKAKQNEAKTKFEKLETELKGEGERLEQMPMGRDRDQALKNFRDKAMRARFELQYSQKLHVETQGEAMRDLYTKMSDAAKRLARKNGYSMVMSSDQNVETPKGDPSDLVRFISLRRIIYVDGQLDITQELVTMMNNEYATGGKP